MTGITRAGVRWPGRVALGWLVGVVVLTIIGLPLNRKLDPPQLVLPGGSAAVATSLSHGHFGEDTYVLLNGSRAAVRARGPAAVAALEHATGAPMISPFSGLGRSAALLWPPHGPATVIIDLTRGGETQVSADQLSAFERQVHRIVTPPLSAVVTGPAPLRQAITDQALSQANKASLIAFPALLLVLLLVFRSAVAAVVPLAVAGATVEGGRGVLLLVAKVMHIDATSDVLLSMIGLALGVDYSLLIVTRYREAIAHGERPGHAVHLAAHTAGKTASFAGAVLIGILGVTFALAPGGALSSAVAGAIVATLMSVFSALLVVPALLTLLGRWISPLPPEKPGLLGTIVERSLRRPWPALLAAVPLIAIALGTTKLATAPPNPLVLPPNSPGGHKLQALGETGIGPGFDIVLSRADGPVTAPSTLRAIARLQRQVAAVVPVRAVIGPAAVTSLARGEPSLSAALRAGGITGAVLPVESASGRGARTVQTVVSSAPAPASPAPSPVPSAVSPAGLSGADGSAGRLITGIAVSGNGAEQLSSTAAGLLGSARSAARASTAAAGIERGSVAPGLGTLSRTLGDGDSALSAAGTTAAAATAQLQQAQAALNAMSVGTLDPHYKQAESALAQAIAALGGNGSTGSLQSQLMIAEGALAKADSEASGLVGSAQSAGAADARAAQRANALDAGLGQVRSQARALHRALDGLGAGGLGGALTRQLTALAPDGSAAAAVAPISPVSPGVVAPVSRTTTTTTTIAAPRTAPVARRVVPAQAVQPQLPAVPGASSGFTALASASAAGAVRLAAVRYVVDEAAGGGTGRIDVFTTLQLNDPRTAGALAKLGALTRAFAARTGIQVAVGGQAAELQEFSTTTKSRLPVIVIGVALITLLALIAVLRSVLLAAIAVALNLLTVGVMFGVLSFLYVGRHPVLGTSHALDVITTVSIFAITFALSIDYQVFLLARMREGYLNTQDSVYAIRFGVEHTARIVTGAALIMLATFAAFGTTNVANVQQLGVGIGSAILVDATVVRLVVLPAILRLVGDRAWWLPDRMERRLPELDVEGFAYVRSREEISTRAAEVW